MTGRTGGPAGEVVFESRKPASENRVGAIVAAYDEASREIIEKLVAWTNAQAKPNAA